MGILRIPALGLACALLYIAQDAACYNTKVYRHRGLKCSLCPPGYQRSGHCSENSDTECSPCKENRFMPFWNRANRCFRCKSCLEPLKPVSGCTSTQDAVCQCPEGYFDEVLLTCRPQRKCPKGFGVVKQGTPSTDVTCQECSSGFYSNTVSSTEPCRKHTNCSSYNLAVRDPGNETHPRTCIQIGELDEPDINLDEQDNQSSSMKFFVVTAALSTAIVLFSGICLFLVFKKLKKGCPGKSPERPGYMAPGQRCNKGGRRWESTYSFDFETPDIAHDGDNGNPCIANIGNSTIPTTDDASSQCSLQDENGLADCRLDVFPNAGDLQIIENCCGSYIVSARKRTKSLEEFSQPSYKGLLSLNHSHTICRSLNRIGNVRGLEKQQLVGHFGFDKRVSHLATENKLLSIRSFNACVDLKPQLELGGLIRRYLSSGRSRMEFASSKCHNSNISIEKSTLQVIPPVADIELNEVVQIRQVAVKDTNRAWEMVLPSCIPKPFGGQEMVCLDLVKDLKAANVNVCPTSISERDQRHPDRVRLWEEGSSLKHHKRSCFYRYGSRGGCLSVSPSAQLTIPPKAIPEGVIYGIKGTPLSADRVSDISALLDVEGGEHIVSPLIDYEICDSKHFARPTKLSLEHCVVDPDALDGIKVYTWSQFDPLMLTEVPRQSKDNNVRQDTCFVVEDDGTVSIYTTHFTVFVPTGGKSETLQVEAKLFKKREESEDVYNVQVYLCADLATTKHYKEDFAREQDEMGLQLCGSKVVKLPDEVFPHTTFNVELADTDDGWERCLHMVNNLDAFPLKQTLKAKHFIVTGSSARPFVAGEWWIGPNGSTNVLKRGVVIQPVAEKETVDPTIFLLTLSPATSPTNANEVSSCINELSKFDLVTELERQEWDSVFQYVAQNMKREDSRTLATSLHIPYAKVSHIEEGCKVDTPRFTQEMCYFWRQKNPEKYLSDFIDALKKVAPAVAVEVVKVVKEEKGLVELDNVIDKQKLCGRFTA